MSLAIYQFFIFSKNKYSLIFLFCLFYFIIFGSFIFSHFKSLKYFCSILFIGSFHSLSLLRLFLFVFLLPLVVRIVIYLRFFCCCCFYVNILVFNTDIVYTLVFHGPKITPESRAQAGSISQQDVPREI